MAEITMRERKKEATKNNILLAAVELINERGFSDTTMQLIAEKADVSLRTLYNYFPTKESIVATYVQREVQREQENSWAQLINLQSTRERLRVLCLKSAEWMRKNRLLAEVYTLELDPRSYICVTSNADFPKSGLDELVMELIALGQKQGDMNQSLGVEVLTRQFFGFYHFSILTWLCDTSQEVEELFEQGLKLLFDGIGQKENRTNG